MCGIAGFVGLGDREVLARMTSAIAHRGPDADGFWSDEKLRVYLGHRRLSILDHEGGAQPMWLADGAVGIVFNGEIYNHAELRTELEGRGCVFVSDHSDTEVLLHAYREWGDGFVSRLNGMWAFAIFDRSDQRIFLSRDRFGKKPLYWFQRNETFGFASELSALACHPECPQKTSTLALAKFFAHALIPAPHTILDGVWKLRPGHSMVVPLAGGEPAIARYWEYELDPHPVTDPAAAEGELLDVLRRAVTRRLIADVPLGIFLSGGIDSSLIAALASESVAVGNLKTFSIGFTEASFDELPFANLVARQIGSEHQTQILDLDATLDLLPGILSRIDEPQGDASLLPTWLLSRFARESVTVALGGDGGDELFAGYDPFLALRKAELYAKCVPKPVHMAIRLLAGSLPVSHRNLSLDFKIKRTLRGLSYPAALWNPVWMGALEPDEISNYLGVRFSQEEIYSEAISAWESCPQGDLVDRTLQYFTRIYLADGILAKVDRASMLNALEVRAPFLDLEVANFARHLPNDWKLRGGETKSLLKRAASRVLPPEIVQRRKKGFGTPVGKWLREGSIAPQSNDPFVQTRVAAHQSGNVDDRLFLWCQMALEAWQKEFQDGLGA